MKKNILLAILVFCYFQSFAQFAPDFTITDTNGNQHTLYEDYLDQDKVVVLKFFFVGCPPCTAIAPSVQALHQEFGSNQDDVIFLYLTIFESDTNASVRNYMGDLDVTIPAAGGNGGGQMAAQPYLDGDFGSFWGTPAFAVINPMREVSYFATTSSISAIRDQINIALGMEIEMEPEPTTYEFNFVDIFGKPVNDVEVSIVDLDPNNNVEIPVDFNGSSSFEITSFEDEYPSISNPAFSFKKEDGILDGVSIADIIKIQDHILSIETITDQDRLTAADVSGNQSISISDIIALRKVILGIESAFPNGLNWIIQSSDVPVESSPGNTISIEVRLLKMGNVSG